MSSSEIMLARRYVLLDRIGVGGMGEVWRVHDQIAKTTVAAKILRPPIAAAPAAEVRFQREIHAMARLNHPRVVPIIDAGRDPILGLFFVMELLPGVPLHDASHCWTSWAELSSIADQVLETLGHAHSQSVIHRDIKPDNILVDENGESMLLDFGVARMKDRARSGTSAYDLLGTVDYAAPEQATGNRRRIGPWTDIYCFGIVLFELICGRMPFWASSPVQALIMRLDSGCPPLEPRPGFETPKGLWDVLNRMLQPEPLDRFRCTADAREAFSALAGNPMEVLTAAVDGYKGISDLPRREQHTDNQVSSQRRHKQSLLNSSFSIALDRAAPKPPLRTTTLVGRDRLLMDLSKALGRWITNPGPGALVISGEKGSGKSRVLREVIGPYLAQGELEGHHHRWSYGSSMKEIALSISGALGLADETLEEHIEWWLEGHHFTGREYRDVLAWLTADDATLSADGEEGIMGVFLEGCCAEKPFLLAIDSVGVFDQDMIGLISAIRNRKLKVIVFFTAVEINWGQDCEEPAWFTGAHRLLEPLNTIQLNRILDGMVTVSDELRGQLIEYADGNPERLLDGVQAARRSGQVVPSWPLWLTAPDSWKPLGNDCEDDEGLNSMELSVLASPDFDV
jgi:serine/threonine protein kinase